MRRLFGKRDEDEKPLEVPAEWLPPGETVVEKPKKLSLLDRADGAQAWLREVRLPVPRGSTNSALRLRVKRVLAFLLMLSSVVLSMGVYRTHVAGAGVLVLAGLIFFDYLLVTRRPVIIHVKEN